jgi:hypothetical protein
MAMGAAEVCTMDPRRPGVRRFVPEVLPAEVPVTADAFRHFFPVKNGVTSAHVRLTNIGTYSMTAPAQADVMCAHIAAALGRPAADVCITDALANMGGMTMAFARHFKRVNACEIVPLHCDILRHNLNAYGLADKVAIRCGDYMDHVLSLEQDVVYFDPPWGGPEYRRVGAPLSLGIDNVNIACIIQALLRPPRPRAECVVMRVPVNYAFGDLHTKLDGMIVTHFHISRGVHPQALVIVRRLAGANAKSKKTGTVYGSAKMAPYGARHQSL